MVKQCSSGMATAVLVWVIVVRVLREPLTCVGCERNVTLDQMGVRAVLGRSCRFLEESGFFVCFPFNHDGCFRREIFFFFFVSRIQINK